MRSLWHWLGTVLLVVAGCRSTTPDLKPQNVVDDYALPSEDDPRYNQPYKYTKDSSNPSLPSSRTNSGAGGGPGMGPRGGRGGIGPTGVSGPSGPSY